MTRPLARTLSVALSAILSVLTAGACGATSDLDGSSSSGDASQGDCSNDADCAGGKLCGFPASDGCAAKGVCVAPLDYCADGCFTAEIACDGRCVCIDCSTLPDGFYPVPLPAALESCPADGATII